MVGTSQQTAAILVEPGRIELQDRPVPEPGPGEIVLRVVAATTCGTDLKMYRRGHPLFDFPTPFGHEYSGVVHAVGAGVDRFAEGDAVMAVHSAPCGTCRRCRRGLENLCETLIPRMALGAYGQYIRLSARHVEINTYPMPEGLSFAEASLLEPLSCVVYGRQLLRLDAARAAGEPPLVVVYGAGPIALMYVRLLRAEGARVIVVARREVQRNRANAFGAEQAVAPAEAIDAIRAATGTDALADAAVDCTGAPSVWEACAGLVDLGGEVLLNGGAPGGTSVTFDTRRLHYDQLHLHGVFHFDPAAVRAAREWILSGKLGLADLLTAREPLSNVADVFASMDAGATGVKTVIEPGCPG